MARMPVEKTAVAKAAAQDNGGAAAQWPTEGTGDAAAWAEAKRRYPDASDKLTDIAKLVGLFHLRLSQIAKRDGWPMRGAAKTSGKRAALAVNVVAAKLDSETDNGSNDALAAIENPADAKAPELKEKTKKKPARKKPPKASELLCHVRSTLSGELTKLDKQSGDTSQDRERASRALSQMVNSLEKAIEMQREISKDTTKGAAKKNKEELAHAEDLRRAIAERIERLQSKRAPDAGSAAGDGS